MNFLQIVILNFFFILKISASPVEYTGNGCGRYLWNVIGNHFDGENCEQSTASFNFTQNYVKKAKSRINKRETKSVFGLESVGNLMSALNSHLNLNQKKEPGAMCTPCEMAIRVTKIFLGFSSDEDILNFVTKLCVKINIMPEEICEGFVQINGPPMVHILRTSKMSSIDICSFLVKTDCNHKLNEDHVWHVEIPEELSNETEQASQGINKTDSETPQLKVLHISDIHFDPLYKEGTYAECTLPLCCRDSYGEPTPNATLSGPWGGWKCDIPEKTLDNLFEHINKQHEDIDYVIWTGDIPPHDLWSLQKNDSLNILHKIISKIKKHFPNIPVFPALGNHESVPANLFPHDAVAEDEWKIDWLYDKIEEEWALWLNKTSSDTIRRGGFYTAKVRPNLRIISLNMNFCYHNNWWLILNSTDPEDELKWLVEILLEAEKNQEKVHIIGHIPAGFKDCLKVWQENYYNILKRFKSTITAQFFGHTHLDEFELFYDDNDLDTALAVAYIGPSVTTYTFLNPGYRIYYVDGDHKETTRLVTDHETWIMDLEQANEKNYPEWRKLYSAKDAYNMTSLTPQDWHKVFQRLFNDDDFFNLYYKHYWKNSPRREPCKDNCKKNLFCGIRSCDQYGEPDNLNI